MHSRCKKLAIQIAAKAVSYQGDREAAKLKHDRPRGEQKEAPKQFTTIAANNKQTGFQSAKGRCPDILQQSTYMDSLDSSHWSGLYVLQGMQEDKEHQNHSQFHVQRSINGNAQQRQIDTDPTAVSPTLEINLSQCEFL